MPAISNKKLPKHLQLSYKGAQSLDDMDKIDGSIDILRDLIDGGIYEAGNTLDGYEPIERVSDKRERITMSIPSHNLIHLKMLANKKEIPYQTYLNSIIREHIEREMMTR